MGGRYCEAPECLNLATRGGLCEGHRKQRQRTGKMDRLKPKMSRRAAFLEGIIAVADADDADPSAFKRAWERMSYHARRYFDRCG